MRAVDLAVAQSAVAKARTTLHEVDRATVLAALSRHADAAVATIAREYSKSVDEGSERELPGPTGERDSWRLEPRGLAVALGGRGDQPAIWGRAGAAAVAAGDPVLLVSDGDAAAATTVAALVRGAGWPAIAAASDSAGALVGRFRSLVPSDRRRRGACCARNENGCRAVRRAHSGRGASRCPVALSHLEARHRALCFREHGRGGRQRLPARPNRLVVRANASIEAHAS